MSGSESRQYRSELMSKIRSVSAMEVRARGIATTVAGCRLVHQPKGVLGRPDYANKSRQVAVFVHGCFWHACPWHGTMPKSNRPFWQEKFQRNRNRHAYVAAMLRKSGWRVITVWEHQVKRR